MEKLKKNLKIRNFNIAVIIPTCNASPVIFTTVLQAINYQTIGIKHKIIIDSESDNNTRAIAKSAKFGVLKIKRSDFNHGTTRDAALKYLLKKDSKIDIVIFLTQDAVLADTKSVANIIAAFTDKRVAAAYGRQLVSRSSSILERVSRAFNYPDRSYVKSHNDISKMGMNTPFLSNSFAAYRVSDYINFGGFVATNFGEDMLLAAQFIMNRRVLSYRATATVYHSHSYSIEAEYERGKAIAIMHNNNPLLLQTFGNAESRGAKMVFSAKFYQIPVIILESLPKLFGYRLHRWRKTIE